jgi:ABC-type multidrug transport system permease subunit
LKTIANLNPVTKANEAARMLLINGSLNSSQASTYMWDMVYLVVFATLLGILGYLAARRALRPE